MFEATIVAPDGSKCSLHLAEGWSSAELLQVLQEAVGGYIEVVSCGSHILIVNEEGLIKNLMHNEVASKIAGQRIVGTVVVMKRSIWESYNE